MPSEDLTLSRAALPRIAALVGSYGVGAAPAAETFALDARGDSPMVPAHASDAPPPATVVADAPIGGPAPGRPVSSGGATTAPAELAPEQPWSATAAMSGASPPAVGAPTPALGPEHQDPLVILNACWTPAQLAGSPQNRTIRRGLKPDRTPLPEWAIRAGATGLPPLTPRRQGSVRSVDPADPRVPLVALSELLAAGHPSAVAECYEERPGDNRRYDALFGRGSGG